MTIFQYKAIDQEGKEVSGTLDAPSDDAARTALEAMHFEVLEVDEAHRHKDTVPERIPISKSPMKTFAFEGKEPNGAVKRGTIQAVDKYQAFSTLRLNQNLFVNMLSPLGVTPQFRDNDLENWQRKDIEKKNLVVSPVATETKKVQGTPPIQSAAASKSSRYVPILDTLRLYAGWLLAWYSLFVAVGYYSSERELPFDIPLVQGFYLSPLIFSFTVAIFLFLLLTSLYKATKGGVFIALGMLLLGLVSFITVRLSI